MKITLIKAMASNDLFRGINLVPLGIPILGTMQKNQGHDVSIYSEDISPIDWQDVLSSDLVGISAFTIATPRAYEIAKEVKKHGIPVVMGGPHASVLPEEALREGVNFVVRQEGEKTFGELVETLAGNNKKSTAPEDFQKINGLSYEINDELFHNPDRPPLTSNELNSLPFPDFSLIKGFKAKRVAPLMTSRGCPYNCKFCTVTRMFGHGYRFRNKENVLEEMERLSFLFPHSYLFFYDDNFAADPIRAKEILRGKLEKNIKTPWIVQVRADLSEDKELLALMQKTNCFQVLVGFESLNPCTLEEDYEKKQRINDGDGKFLVRNAKIKTAEEIEKLKSRIKLSYAKTIKSFHSFDIGVVGFFVLGGEDDNKSCGKELAKFAVKSKLDLLIPWILTPLPGTETTKEMAKEKRIMPGGPEKWKFFDALRPVFRPKKISAEELFSSAIECASKFYSPVNIAKTLTGTIKHCLGFSSLQNKKFKISQFGFMIYGWWMAKKIKKGAKEHILILEKSFAKQKI